MERPIDRLDVECVSSEHEDLILQIRREREWWRSLPHGEPVTPAQIGGRLREFRRRIVEHFVQFETTDAVTASTPRDDSSPVSFASGAGQKARERQALLGDLDDFSQRLAGCGATRGCWTTTSEAFDQVADQLLAFEEAELQSLRSAG